MNATAPKRKRTRTRGKRSISFSQRLWILAFFLMTLFIKTAVAQINPDTNNILYVNQNVSGGNGGGNSWANAVPELADALQWAREQHDNNTASWNENNPLQIWVAQGTYLLKYSPKDGLTDPENPADARDKSFLMIKNVQLYGGFPDSGNPTMNDRDWETNSTVLSGELGRPNDNSDNAYHVLVSAGDVGDARLDGFIVSGGNADGGFTNIRVFGFLIYREAGGGFYNDSSYPVLSNLKFSGNTGTNGGGLYFGDEFNTTNQSMVLTHVEIRGNSGNIGGGLYNYSSSPKLEDVKIIANEALDKGGGLFNYFFSSPILINVLIGDNLANEGSGVYNDSGNGTFTNVTVVDGSALVDNGSTSWSNSIVWGDVSGNKYTAKHCLIRGNTDTSNGNIDASGLTEVDIFTNPGSDYSQKESSPTINAGNNQLYTHSGGDLSNDIDLAGNPRVYDYVDGGVIDVGAYEFQGEPVGIITYDENNILYADINIDTMTPGYTGAGVSRANALPELADAFQWAEWSQPNPHQKINAEQVAVSRQQSAFPDGAFRDR